VEVKYREKRNNLLRHEINYDRKKFCNTCLEETFFGFEKWIDGATSFGRKYFDRQAFVRQSIESKLLVLRLSVK
jgi:hypothetical protein